MAGRVLVPHRHFPLPPPLPLLEGMNGNESVGLVFPTLAGRDFRERGWCGVGQWLHSNCRYRSPFNRIQSQVLNNALILSALQKECSEDK